VETPLTHREIARRSGKIGETIYLSMMRRDDGTNHDWFQFSTCASIAAAEITEKPLVSG
jgi:hypothetical protein